MVHPETHRHGLLQFPDSPVDANLSLIEKNFRCSVKEGLSQDLYTEVFLRIVGPNPKDRLVHEFATFNAALRLNLT